MSTTVFVGNVSYDATENELQDLFAQHGAVTDVNLMVDRVTKKPRGFAFVSMVHIDAQQLSEQQSQVLGMSIGIVVRTGVAHDDIEEAVRPKLQATAAVVLGHAHDL